MAGIDKTYTDSYKEYREFKTWAGKQALTFYNGHKVCIGDWVWQCEESDFLQGEIPIMNSPTWLDIYLIQNCKTEFVLDRMKAVYGKEAYDKFLGIDLTAKPTSDFQQNRKIKIMKSETTKFPFHNKPYMKKTKWWLQCNNNYWYHSETKTWSHYNNYYPRNTNTAEISSIKAVVKHLRRQYLQKGVEFVISGGYVGEEYLIRVS